MYPLVSVSLPIIDSIILGRFSQSKRVRERQFTQPEDINRCG